MKEKYKEMNGFIITVVVIILLTGVIFYILIGSIMDILKTNYNLFRNETKNKTNHCLILEKDNNGTLNYYPTIVEEMVVEYLGSDKTWFPVEVNIQKSTQQYFDEENIICDIPVTLCKTGEYLTRKVYDTYFCYEGFFRLKEPYENITRWNNEI